MAKLGEIVYLISKASKKNAMQFIVDQLDTDDGYPISQKYLYCTPYVVVSTDEKSATLMEVVANPTKSKNEPLIISYEDKKAKQYTFCNSKQMFDRLIYNRFSTIQDRHGKTMQVQFLLETAGSVYVNLKDKEARGVIVPRVDFGRYDTYYAVVLYDVDEQKDHATWHQIRNIPYRYVPIYGVGTFLSSLTLKTLPQLESALKERMATIVEKSVFTVKAAKSMGIWNSNNGNRDVAGNAEDEILESRMRNKSAARRKPMKTQTFTTHRVMTRSRSNKAAVRRGSQ